MSSALPLRFLNQSGVLTITNTDESAQVIWVVLLEFVVVQKVPSSLLNTKCSVEGDRDDEPVIH